MNLGKRILTIGRKQLKFLGYVIMKVRLLNLIFIRQRVKKDRQRKREKWRVDFLMNSSEWIIKQ